MQNPDKNQRLMGRPHSTPAAWDAGELTPHTEWLRRLARTLVGSSQDAEDMAQETLLVAMGAGANAPTVDREIRPWLGGVLRNRVRMLRRRDARGRAREMATAREEALPSAFDLAARADRGRRLVELVLELPEDQRRLVLLRYQEGLMPREIARRLGRPEGTVRSQISRGVAALRERVEAASDGQPEVWLGALVVLPGMGAAGGAGSGAAFAGARLTAGLQANGGLVVAGVAAITSLIVWVGIGRQEAGGAPLAPAAKAAVAALGASNQLAAPLNSGFEREALSAAVAAAPRGAAATEPEVSPLTAATQVTSSIEGSLVDPTSGEGIPYYRLALAERGLGGFEPAAPFLESFTTDEDGQWRAAGEYGAGDYSIVLLEELAREALELPIFRPVPARGSLPFTHAIDADGASSPVALELRVGPLLRLVGAHLDETGPLAVSLTAMGCQPNWDEKIIAPVELEPFPHVRFAPIAGSRLGALKHVHLFSVDGLWTGMAPITLAEGPALQTAEVDAGPAGTVQVQSAFSSSPPGQLLVCNVWPGVETADAIDRVPPRLFGTATRWGPEGVRGTRLRWVPVGTHTLAVESPEFVPSVQTLEIVQGNQEHAVDLVRDGNPTGVIEGLVVCQGGTPPDFTMEVYAGAAEPGSHLFRIQVLEFEEEAGVWQAPFRLESLPDRAMRLQVREHVGFGLPKIVTTTAPEKIVVRPGGEPARFELHPTPPELEFHCVVTDASTGSPLESFRYQIAFPEALAMEEKDGQNGAFTTRFRSLLEGGSLHVAASGYQARSISLPGDDDADGVVTVEIALEPGWSAPFSFKDKESGAPIAGIEIRVDGSLVGTSNEDGVALLLLDERPARVAIQSAGRRVHRVRGPMSKSGRLRSVRGEILHEHYDVQLVPE